MTYLQAALLQCLERTAGERTVYSAFHLLAGKKSSQTIQDAHLFDLTIFFKLLPGLKRYEFDNLLKKMEESGLISREGDFAVPAAETEPPALWELFPFLDGWSFQDAAIVLWKRLTLLVQAVSHIAYGQNRYYPIQRDPEVIRQVKKFLTDTKTGKTALAEGLYKELERLFSGGFPENPAIITSRLSGYGVIGLTEKQAALQFGYEESEYRFRFLHGLHYMVRKITEEPSSHPLLHRLLSGARQELPFTKSTLRTYEMLKHGHPAEEIARMRKLKKSTIEDHIIEIVLIDRGFSAEPFVNGELAAKISEAAKELGQKKLKPIKDRVGQASYFQIRLVLAKMGEWQ